MSDSQYHPPHNTDNEMAGYVGGGVIGRGTGFTIKEMKQRLKEFFQRKKMPSHQWRTLEQKQAALAVVGPPLANGGVLQGGLEVMKAAKAKASKVNFRQAREHPPQTPGIKLKKFGEDVWKRL